MRSILVNEIEQRYEPAPETWGDLLKALDRELGAVGHVVTEARFDGVDEPTFREPAATERPLDTVACVEIVSSSPGDLIRASLDDALQGLAGLREAAIQIADLFRGYDSAAANEGLHAFADGLRLLLGLVSSATAALRIDLDGLDCDGEPAAALLEELVERLDGVIAAQHAEDWISVADGLQYDIEPTLRRWDTLLVAIATQGK